MTLFGPWKMPKCLEKGLVQDQKWVQNGPKTCFSKSDREPARRLKQGFLACFEPQIARFGPWRIPKCLENGPCWDKKWVQNGSKTRFSKSDRRPFGMLRQVFLPYFEPMEIPIFLEMGPFWEQKWVKNWSKTQFSKSDLGTFGVHKQVF